MTKGSFTILLLVTSLILIAQSNNDSLQSTKRSYANLILPSSISLAGIGIQLSGEKVDFQDYLHSKVGRTQNHIDDYIQYIPAVEVLGGDILGIKSKYHWFDRSKYLFISQLLSSSLVLVLKYSFDIQRPANGANNSFPSGHTNLAFVGADNLYQSYKDSSPIYAYSGYFIATSVGVLRMTNNKHWLPDVVLGAGLGILISRLVYHWKPLKRWNPFLNNKNIAFVFTPKYTPFFQGASFQISF